MKKLLSLKLQKSLLLVCYMLTVLFSTEAQKNKPLKKPLKPQACQNDPFINCPKNFYACPKASLDPSNTGVAIGLPGGPNCSPPIITYYDDTIHLGNCSGTIELVRNWKATDPQNSNLFSTCQQSIILSDNDAPVISNCPSNIVATAGQNCKANVSWLAPSVTDNCGKLFLTVNHISGDAFPIGVTTVTYTAEDLCGNITNCNFTITVNGSCCKVKPNITCPKNYVGCPGDSLAPEYTGNAIVTPGDKNCSNPSISYKDSITHNGICPGSIKLIRTWKAEDPYDNSLFSICVQNIELIDDQSEPVILQIPADITVSPGSDCKATVQWSQPKAEDNCGIASFQSNYPSGTSFSEGTTTILYIAIDKCGNKTTKSFTITVTPCCNQNPIIQCPLNYTACPGTSTDPNTTGFATATKALPGCGNPIVSYVDSIVNYSCPDAKMIYRKWKAADPNNSNLFSSCTQFIELKDVAPPSLTSCPTNIIVPSNTTDCKAIVSWNPPTATDNCTGAITYKSNFKPGDAFPIGITTIIYTITDGCGNAIQHQFTITVLDNCCHSKPKINCPPDYKGCPVEHCGTNISGTATTEPSSPGCPIPILSFKDSLLNIYSNCPNAKRLIRIWRATDPNDSKNFVECNQLIELIDKLPPVWNYCPPDITVDANGSCEKAVYWNPPTATDNCTANLKITSNYYPGQKFPAGTTEVVYTAEDDCGNVIKHRFKITVLGVGLNIECPLDIVVDRTDPNLPGAYVSWYPPKVTSCGSCSDTLPGFIYMGTYNGSRYFCSRITETWQKAKAICESLGGHLMVINDQAENNYITGKLMGTTAFIGLHDSNVEGYFEWVDQSPVNYTNWYPGQPNNANGDQDYVEILPDGTWNDQYASSVREFICEIPCYTVKQITGSPSGSLFKCGTHTITYVVTQGGVNDTCQFSVTVNCKGSKYCESKAQYCGNLWIKNVSLSNINNTTGNSNGYEYYPNPCGELQWGKSYTLCLTPGFANNIYTAYWKVWIDYNGDGDFYDQDEFVAYGASNSTLCGTITLPWGCCSVNSTRMRVSMSYGSYPGNPCCSIAYGEVEDYCINIKKNTLLDDDPDLKLRATDPRQLFSAIEDMNSISDETLPQKLDINIVPNPVSQHLSINCTSNQVVTVSIINSKGKLCWHEIIDKLSLQVNVSAWPEGIYFAKAYTQDGQAIIRKFMVLH